MFYSASTGGFYSRDIHGEAIPEDAVELTAIEYAALMEAQCQGKRIVSDANGRPVAVAPPAPSLDEMKAALVLAIDATADAARLAVAGDPLRAEEYRIAEGEAKAYQAAGYAGDVPPAVASWAEAKGWTGQQAADDILAVATAWNAALYAIRDARLKAKEAVRNATTADQAQAIAAEACAGIQAKAAALAGGQS